MGRWGVGRLCVLVVALSLVAGALVASGDAAVARQTRWRAEVNLLHAPRLVARWAPSLVNPRTRLVRSNTVVRCKGSGQAVEGRYHVFSCNIRGAHSQLVVRYTALSVTHFRATRVSR